MPIKVVSERLGHSNPAFTMTTYQHVLAGMQDDAARAFAAILAGNAPRRDPVEVGSDPVEGSKHSSRGRPLRMAYHLLLLSSLPWWRGQDLNPATFGL